MKNILLIALLFVSSAALAEDTQGNVITNNQSFEQILKHTQEIQQSKCASKASILTVVDINKQLERSGCCSWHGGVCGCSSGRAVCCDGNLSPSCGC